MRRREKREDRPILKRLRAALLRSFRGLDGVTGRIERENQCYPCNLLL